MVGNPRTFSLFLPEESPICDLKMDISGSCSSDSPANTSPDLKPRSRAPSYLESDPDDGLRILKSPSDLEMVKSRTAHAIHPSLDNRPQAAQLISVHSHPLMSPDMPSLDNESTNQFFDQDFKDIPLQSPLRLANPLGGSNRTLTPSPKRHVRLGLLDKDSASAVSSDSEADLSQYQANVGPSFQTVSLVAKANTSLAKQKKSKFSSCSNIDEDSADERLRPRQGSVESLSGRSFDDMDALNHLMSRSSSTSLIEDGKLGEAAINGGARPVRNSHTMILPDGTTREIDMKVIEPYKRVLSHGGYLKDDCQNAIVIFSCCFLPDRSRADYRYVMDSLFLCVVLSSSAYMLHFKTVFCTF